MLASLRIRMSSSSSCRADGALILAMQVSLAACRPQAPRSESTVTRHGDDVVVSGAAPDMRDSTLGDVMIAGGKARFSGATGRDYLGAAGDQTVSGRIHGALRAAGGTVRLMGSVDHNATIAGGTVSVDRAGVIGQNGYLAGGTVNIDGAVRGALMVAGGTVVINGPVGGDVDVVAAGEFFVGPDADIAGSLRYRVPNGKMHMDPAAHVAGAVTALPAPSVGGAAYVFGVLWMLGFLATGAVVVAFLPRLMSDTADLVHDRPSRSALVGLGGLILTPIAIVVAASTVIGLPLAFLTTLIYLILVYVSRIGVALWLGRRLMGTRVRLGRTRALANFGVGALILTIVRFIPVLGPLVTFVAVVVGLGALLLRLRYTAPSVFS